MASAPTKPPPIRSAPLKLPRVPLNGRVLLAEDTEIAAELATGAEIDIPVLLGIIILLGVLYSAKYLLIPLMKLAKIPGSNWFSEAVNFVLGAITSPIKGFLQWVKHQIAIGIESHTYPFARAIETMAIEVHDFTVETASLAVTIVDVVAGLKTRIIPRAIDAKTLPLRKRLLVLETVRKRLDAIARKYGYASFPVLVETATPHIKQLVAADIYVRGQGHRSLAGALSVYEAAAKSWTKTEQDVRKLGYWTIPIFIRHVETQIEKVLKPQLQKLRLQVGKIENLLKLNKAGIPILLAAMTPAAIAAFFRPAIPGVCTEVGECAAGNLLGRNIWKYFKDLLGLLLALDIGLFALEDLCAISKLAVAVVGEIEGPIRSIVVISDGLASIGCASQRQTLSPPLY